MKRSLKYTLIFVSLVLFVVCGVLFAIHTINKGGENEPGVLTPDNTQDDQEETPSISGAIQCTVHLCFPDGYMEDYTFLPAKNKFTPTAQKTWMKNQEREGILYRFENWYTDVNYHDVMMIKNLSDGDMVYAKMVEQVVVSIHGFNPHKPNNTQTLRADKNTIFDVEAKVSQKEAQLMAVYSNQDKTETHDRAFVVSHATELYLSWSSFYSDFTYRSIYVSKKQIALGGYRGESPNVVLPSVYPEDNKKYTVVGVTAPFAYSGYEDRVVSVVLPETTIPEKNELGALKNCPNLTSLTTPLGDKPLYEYFGSFNEDCLPHSLKEITIINDTELCNFALVGFGNNNTESYFSKITLSDSITSIGLDAFAECIYLTEIKLPSELKTIGIQAFSGCDSLTSIVIPSKVESIKNYAFCWSAVEVMTFLSEVPPVIEGSSLNRTATAIYVPAGSVEAYKTAEIWSNFADIIQAIPEE